MKTLSPAMRIIIVHCLQTGGLLPGDPVRAPKSTLDAMVKRGLLRSEGDGFVLTAVGKAAYAWS